ncbi:hypothetical protein [Nostoc sp. ChiQUE01b]|uniref:hypothetical protein n=1 Tax=Nostoc sp. ChiQUE01b TaxID=3075376 RepID=UPI002AD4B373|nr:hypothetical protein [Nostoc sp. ChiQUE01b]MDZ8258591.1 hypothetical protein [Nostoc sp. ChiQUE01b]
MATVFDNIALQFQKLNKLPYRLYGEAYTYLNLIGDVAGKSILDLACGEGFIPDDGESISIDNYYLSQATYEWALMSAGFKEIRWHHPIVCPKGIEKFGSEFWQDYIDYPDMIGITCLK